MRTAGCTSCGQPFANPDSLTATQIHEILDKHLDENDSDWDELGDDGGGEPYYGTPIGGLGLVQLVERVGGMGQGDHAHLVWQIGSRLFRMDGYYQSHSGTTYDGPLYEVQRKERTQVVYE